MRKIWMLAGLVLGIMSTANALYVPIEHDWSTPHIQAGIEESHAIAATQDGGCITQGAVYDGLGGSDIRLTKYRANGTRQGTLDLPLTGYATPGGIAQTPSDGYVHVGFVHDGQNLLPFMQSISRQGTVNWIDFGPGTPGSAITADALTDIIALPDTTFLLCGWKHNGQNDDGYIARMRPDRTLMWETVVDGNGGTDSFQGLAVHNSGAIYAVGSLDSVATQARHLFAVKLDGNGNVQWKRSAGTAFLNDGIAVDVHSTGTLVVFGGQTIAQNGNADYLAVAFNEAGVSQWEHTYDSGSMTDFFGDVVWRGSDLVMAGEYDEGGNRGLLILDDTGTSRYFIGNTTYHNTMALANDRRGPRYGLFSAGNAWGANQEMNEIASRWQDPLSWMGAAPDPAPAVVPDSGGAIWTECLLANHINPATVHLRVKLVHQNTGTISYPMQINDMNFGTGHTPFWISISVPASALAGMYDAHVELIGRQSGQVLISADFEFEKLLTNPGAPGDGGPNEWAIALEGLDNTGPVVTDSRFEDTLLDLAGSPHSNATLTAGTDTQQAGVPSAFLLRPAYPNPFNPSTTVEVVLPATTPLTITVHNTLGRTVATLVDGRSVGAGVHRFMLDGSRLASGTYLVRAATPGQSPQLQRVVLVK